MSPAPRRLAALLTVSLLATGCNMLGQLAATPLPSSSPSPSPTAAPYQPQSAWERALEDIGDDGHFSKEAALNLFATAFGPLPGVDVQQDLAGIFDRTLAINAVEEHASELSADQQAAFDNYLKPPPDATIITIEPKASRAADPMLALAGGPIAAVTDARKAELTSLANNVRDIIALKLRFDIPAFDIAYADRPSDLKPVLGQYPLGGAHGTYGADGQNTGCKITVFNESTAESDQVLHSLLAHEIFHCFQYAGYGTLAAKDAAPAWVIEGQAAWVGQAVGGVSGKYDRFWDEYITVPQKPLTTRSYDAMGFYAHLEERQISPWDAFKPMWAAGGNNLEIFKASGANVDNFINTWASGVLRDESRGDGWDTTGPGITASKYGPLAVGVANGAKVNVSQPFFTNDITQLEFDADMVSFAIDGHGRLNDGSIDTTALDGVWYCVAGHNCEKDPDCPDAADLPDIVGTINGTAYLATSGGIDGTVGTVTGKDLEKDCATPTPTATADEFCSRYRDYVTWAKSNGSDEITKPLAGEIANRFLDMQPYAPAELAVHVALMIRVYSTYASAPPYIDLPMVGPDAAHIPEALTAMNNYCHVSFP